MAFQDTYGIDPLSLLQDPAVQAYQQQADDEQKKKLKVVPIPGIATGSISGKHGYTAPRLIAPAARQAYHQAVDARSASEGHSARPVCRLQRPQKPCRRERSP